MHISSREQTAGEPMNVQSRFTAMPFSWQISGRSVWHCKGRLTTPKRSRLITVKSEHHPDSTRCHKLEASSPAQGPRSSAGCLSALDSHAGFFQHSGHEEPWAQGQLHHLNFGLCLSASPLPGLLPTNLRELGQAACLPVDFPIPTDQGRDLPLCFNSPSSLPALEILSLTVSPGELRTLMDTTHCVYISPVLGRASGTCEPSIGCERVVYQKGILEI